VKLSLVITNYKTPELLNLCLKSIKETLNDVEKEVFVMDAETNEDTEFVVKGNFPEFNLVPFEKNVGFTHLVNEGLKKANGEFIFILNSDIILAKGAAGKLINYLSQNQDVGLVGPQLLNLDNMVQESCRRFFGPLTILASRTIFGKTGWGKKILDKSLMRDYDHKRTIDVDWIFGAALMVKREALEKVGLMDKRFFMYLSDADWCFRFWQAGYRVVYLPEVKIYHYHLRVSKKRGGLQDLFINKYTWIHIFDAIKYFLKYGTKASSLNKTSKI